MYRTDGGIVDAELLRPRWWIAQHNIVAGKHLPMNIEELQVHGSAIVTAVDECPEIAGSSQPEALARELGSVVTARFITREVNTIARAEVIGPDGTIETISGTPIHPIWSVDRNDWVPLGELTEGETLQSSNGIATVLSLALVTCSLPVYNIEVHGEHVYEVGELGLLVHNQCHHIVSHYANANRGWSQAWSQMGQRILSNADVGIHSLKNKIDLLVHKCPHPELYHQRIYERLADSVRGLSPNTPEYTSAVVAELQSIATLLQKNSSALNGVGL